MTEERLFEVLDRFLSKDTSYRHMFLLADSGMGKSSCMLNYYVRNQRRLGKRRHRLVVVPLGIPDADAHIEKIPHKPQTVVFLDALDEDTRAIEDHGARLRDLLNLCRDFRRVLISCRTQFFPRDEEIPVDTGLLRVDPRKAGEKGSYQFLKLYLSPLNDQQVRKFLRKRFRLWHLGKRRCARRLVGSIPLLSVRPMLLAFIPDLMATELRVDHSFELYSALVESWLDRESGWVTKENLRAFSERLAVDLFLNRASRGAERIPRSELIDLAREWEVQLDDWQLTGRSLLNRDAAGNYKFAHRSIMEYVFVKCFCDGQVPPNKEPWTDQMKAFLVEMMRSEPPRTLTLRGADLSQTDLSGLDLSGADLSQVNLANANLGGANLIGATLTKVNVTGANLRGLAPQTFIELRKNGALGLPDLLSGERIVIDTQTGLMWTQNDNGKDINWYEAEEYSRKLSLGGYRDWRLPTIEELEVLYDTESQEKIKIQKPFRLTERWAWSSTKEGSARAWYFYFGDGYRGRLPLDDSGAGRALCVRRSGD